MEISSLGALKLLSAVKDCYAMRLEVGLHHAVFKVQDFTLHITYVEKNDESLCSKKSY